MKLKQLDSVNNAFMAAIQRNRDATYAAAPVTLCDYDMYDIEQVITQTRKFPNNAAVHCVSENVDNTACLFFGSEAAVTQLLNAIV